MPALSVIGVPEKTPKKKLRQLRAELIAVVEQSMGIKPGITRVFFPTDMLGDPDKGQDDLIWVFLYTGMFEGKPAQMAKETTGAVAAKVKAAFNGKHGVEVFVRACDAKTKTLLHAD